MLIEKGGMSSHRLPLETNPTFCVFEHVYFSRPDSYVFGESVNEVRTQLGRALAAEAPVDADVIVPIPDSGVCAAVGYADASGVPMRMGLIRNHYVGRTFIQPQQSIRHFGVRVKLNPVRSIIEGKRVVLIDDSIVRGTTSRKIVRMVRSAGAREVHMRISCPPTVSPCFYGVDTPRRSELIAATHTHEEIRKYLDADSLAYLSLDGLTGAVNGGRSKYCTSCYTGTYPVAFPRDETAYLQLALKLNGDGAAAERPEISMPQRVRDSVAGLIVVETTYSASGVNIDAGNETVRRIRVMARSTFTAGVLSDIGSFGGLFRLEAGQCREPVLVSSADG